MNSLDGLVSGPQGCFHLPSQHEERKCAPSSAFDMGSAVGAQSSHSCSRCALTKTTLQA